MITNFKIFEKLDFKYNEGDYVKLNIGDPTHPPIFAKILNLKKWPDIDEPSYYAEIINFKGDNWNRSWTYDGQIERKANAEEMEDIKRKEDVNKYNL